MNPNRPLSQATSPGPQTIPTLEHTLSLTTKAQEHALHSPYQPHPQALTTAHLLANTNTIAQYPYSDARPPDQPPYCAKQP